MSTAASSGDLTIPEKPETLSERYSTEFRDWLASIYHDNRLVCSLVVKNEQHWRHLLKSDAFELARAFILSEFDVDGDLIGAIRFFRKQVLTRSNPGYATKIAYLWQQFRQKSQAGSTARDIQFHYDRSNDFYRCFLDSRMVYSCGYFRDSDLTLEQAQLAKLDHICRKLQLQPGDRFLDIGCGWGALALHSAARYGTFSSGCTLSDAQLALAQSRAEQAGLVDRVSFFKSDYRDLAGTFDRIASVGMFEHVGHKALDTYFSKVAGLLPNNGMFLNHGIVRPTSVQTDPETLFLSRYVFPGGELVRLVDVIRSAEKAGFEVVDIENLRPHYALTCKAWVDRLIRNRAECLEQVNLITYRTWLLYLAASCVSFETGQTEIHQALFVKRGATRSMTRDYMYR